LSCLQAEGQNLARKNGELEAAVRKLRSSVRLLETERDRAAARMTALEGSLSQEQERAVQAMQAAAAQVRQRPAAGRL
jgi:predicted  nucleic acid-binding Zn-ribbon protein